MATPTHVEIDRARIKELTEREAARLDERTQGSREFYARAQKSLVGGVASSYQVARPVADLPLARQGRARVGRRRQRATSTSTTASARWCRATRTDAISKAVQRADRARHALRRADRGRDRRRRGARAPLGAAEVALRQLRLRGDDGRDPDRARRDRPRHDREDLRLLPRPPRLRDGLDRRRVRPDRRPLRPPVAALRRSASRRPSSEMTIAVPFNDAEAMERRIERLVEEGRAPACVIMEPAMMNLGVVLPEPGYLEAVREITRKHGVLLIFDEVKTGLCIAAGGARRALRRHARPRHAREGARRRAARRARSAAPRRRSSSSRPARSCRSAPTTATRSRWRRRARTCSRC